MFWAIVGIVLGGRVTYVLLYNPGLYLEYPLEALKIWHGGMSLHGGLVGCIAAVGVVCRKHKVGFAHILDLCACSAPVGLFLGRVANLINGELYGKVTTTCIGITFPSSGDLLPRHPSQIYEAVLEGLLPLLFMNALMRYTKIRLHAGALSCIFGIWYGTVRCAVEFLREPDIQIGYVAFGWLTMGQILSAPVVAVCAVLLATIARRKRLSEREEVATI